MSTKTMVVILALMLLAMIMGIYVILMLDSKKHGKNVQSEFAKNNKRFKFYNDNFLTRSSFRKVVEQVSRLSIYNFMEVRIISVKFYQTTMLISFGMFIVGAFLTKDLMATIVIAIYALVMRNVLINKRIDDVTYQLLKQYSVTLSNLYEAYTKTHDIVESIQICEKGSYLVKPFEQIYTILTAVNGKAKLDEFYHTSPFRLLRTLATTSYLLNDEGDAKNEKDQYAYQQAILLIKNEVDDEVFKLLKQRTMFSMLEYLPLAPIMVIGPLQSFFIANIPGTSIVYNGMLGYISRILIVVGSLAAYYIITTINRGGTVRSNDRLEMIDDILHVKPIKHFVKQIMPKKARIKHAISMKLKNALSEKDIEYVYASKALCSLIAFVFTIIVLIITTVSAKQFVGENVKSLSFTGGTDLTPEEERNLQTFDYKILEMDFVPDENSLTEQLKPVLPKATTFDLLEQAERVKKKYNTYHSIHYRWWYILVAYAIAIICWFLPEVQIKIRRYIIKSEAQEDVLQMQTLIAILMYTPLDTLDTLYWLERNSQVHKDALLFAYHEYVSDPEMALNRLKKKSAVTEFHQICDKLLSTIYEVTLKDAFPDLIGQREHIMKTREVVQLNMLEKKRRLASPISLLPLAILVIMHVIAPIGILGFQEFSNALKNIM